MTTEKETGGPAFPQFVVTNGGAHIEGGMALRDYFAAKVMQATLSNPHTMSELAKRFPPKMDMIEGLSGYAYLVADAMLEARK